MELEPVDMDQCQAEKPNGQGPFTLGGGHKMVRCTDRARVIITEKVAAKDGCIGKMSLCLHCLGVFKAQAGTPEVNVSEIER